MTDRADERTEPRPPLMVVAYYTLETPYEREVENLVRSLDDLPLACDIMGVPNLGSWQANTQYKAVFLKEMLSRHGARHRLLYVDADAVFRGYPRFLDEVHCDIAVHITPRNPLSGTIYLEPTAATGMLVDAWIECNRANPKNWDQLNLGVVIQKHEEQHGLRVVRLPVEYAFIFDTARRAHPNARPIIEHFQASRRLKRAVQRRSSLVGGQTSQ